MNPQVILTIVSSLFVLALIVTVLLKKNKTKRVNFLFGVLLSALAWLVLVNLSNERFNKDIDLLINRLVFVVVPIFSFTFYQLVGTFRNGPTSWKKLDIPILFFTIIAIVTTTTPFFIKGISYDESTKIYNIDPGLLYIPLTISVISSILVTLIQLIALLKVTKGVDKLQIRILLFATGGLTILATITNFVIPAFTGSAITSLFAPLWLLLWLSLITYSILRHRLFGIRYVVGELIYNIILVSIPYSFFYLISWVQTKIWGSIYSTGAYLSGILVTIFYLFASNKLSGTFRGLINKYFVYSAYNPQSVVEEFNKEISNQLDITKISEILFSTLSKTFAPLKVTVAVLNQENTDILFKKSQEFEHTKDIQEKELTGLVNELKSLNNLGEAILKEDLEQYGHSNSKLDSILHFLVSNNLEGIFPFSHELHQSGFVLIGTKENESAYEQQDIDLLVKIVANLSVAVGRSLLYEEVQDLNRNLSQCT